MTGGFLRGEMLWLRHAEFSLVSTVDERGKTLCENKTDGKTKRKKKLSQFFDQYSANEDSR